MSKDTRAAILDSAEALLARHGAGKVGIVDVARALGMSHANVYRFFPSKAALFDAVAGRWLARDSAPFYRAAESKHPPADRLERWLVTIYRRKRRKIVEEPELFAFYRALSLETNQNFIARHNADLAAQARRIVEDGILSGDFRVADPDAAVRAILDATASLRHPAIVANPAALDEKRVRGVARMIAAALAAGGM